MDEINKNLNIKIRRDEAAYAFRKYARLGLDRCEMKPFEAYARMRGVSKSECDAVKLLAVYDTMRLLKFIDSESESAVRAVYFADRGRYPLKNQTSERILRFADENHLDERTVYRRLKRAKELYYSLFS
jgi:hypothetical protein